MMPSYVSKVVERLKHILVNCISPLSCFEVVFSGQLTECFCRCMGSVSSLFSAPVLIPVLLILSTSMYFDSFVLSIQYV